MHARSHLQQASQRQDNPVAGDEALKCMVRLLSEGAGGMMHEDGERACVKMLHVVSFFLCEGVGVLEHVGESLTKGEDAIGCDLEVSKTSGERAVR